MSMLNNRLNAASVVAVRDGTYHRDIHLPALLAQPFIGHFRPDYTDHARKASLTDRYGLIELPESLRVSLAEVIEVEVRGGVAVKAVVRVRYNEHFDLVLPICRPCGGYAVVKTVWLNASNDSHKSLRRDVYAVAA